MGQLSVDLSAKIESLRTKNQITKTGIEFPRHFTCKLEAGRTPYDEIQWETRTASIGNDKGSVIFEQRDVETPVDWSQTATNIVASKYFYGKLGSGDRAGCSCSSPRKKLSLAVMPAPSSKRMLRLSTIGPWRANAANKPRRQPITSHPR